MKLSLMLVLGALLFNLNAGFSQSLADIEFGTDSTFEIATWNIEWFPKNGMATVDSVQAILAAAQVDIWAIQEIDDTTLCRLMVHGIPGYTVYQDDNWFDGLVYIWKEDAITVDSIYRIYDTSPFWTAFPRSPLVLDFHRNGERWVLINNHFKCCGDGTLNQADDWDEETRRLTASNLLEDYIDTNLPEERVVMLGDLNDLLIETPTNNVFVAFFDKPLHYRFADLPIAAGDEDFWSYPGWPSHIDHILLTDEFFTEMDSGLVEVHTLLLEEYMAGGIGAFDNFVSDHRPVAIRVSKPVEPPVSTWIGDKASPALVVFPNPSDDLFHFQIATEVKGTHLTIYDLQGRLLDRLAWTESTITWSSRNYAAGMYRAVYSDENGWQSSAAIMVR